MEFCIQAGAPRSYVKFDEDDENLWEAIESVYPLYTENGIIIWNGIYVPISYKYDVSIMISDVIKMLQAIQENEKGDMEICWSSDTFDSLWNIKWNSSDIEITAKWNNVMGGLVEILNSKPFIKVDKKEFVFEWKMMLETIKKALNNAGYTELILPDFKDLNTILNQIPKFGKLYDPAAD